jgi:prolipoprotein diacylglyceryltransferase
LDISNSLVPIIPLCQSLGRWGNFWKNYKEQ